MTLAAGTNKRTWGGKVELFLYWNICAVFFFIPISTSLLEISSVLALAVWLFSGTCVRDRHKWWHEAWVKPVLLFMFLPLIALLWAEDLGRGLDLASKSYYWLLSFTVASLSFKEYSYKRVIDAFLLGLLFSACVVALQVFGIVPLKGGRAAAFMGPITLSLFFVLGIVLVSYYFSRASTLRQKIAAAAVMVLFVFSMAATGGRIGYLVCLLLSPWILYNIFGRRYILGMVIAASLAVAVVATAPVVQQRAVDTVKNTEAFLAGIQKNSSVGLRFQMWSGAVQIFLDNPLLGVGTGGFNRAIREYSDEPLLRGFDQPHNSYLYIASSYGAVGLFSLFWLFGVFFLKGWRARNTLEGYSIVAFALVLFLGSMTDSQILSLATAKMFSLFVGMNTGYHGS